jgi:uncharacterized protein
MPAAAANQHLNTVSRSRTKNHAAITNCLKGSMMSLTTSERHDLAGPRRSHAYVMTRARMDQLVEEHFRAEVAGDLQAIASGFAADAEHDVAGRPGPPLHGGDQIRAFYGHLLADLKIERFERVRRWYGHNHLADESIMHGIATGRPFGLDGQGRAVHARLLHVFDFAGDRIRRESAWLDLAALQQQLAT